MKKLNDAFMNHVRCFNNGLIWLGGILYIVFLYLCGISAVLFVLGLLFKLVEYGGPGIVLLMFLLFIVVFFSLVMYNDDDCYY